jgi:hypothetical protein
MYSQPCTLVKWSVSDGRVIWDLDALGWRLR